MAFFGAQENSGTILGRATLTFALYIVFLSSPAIPQPDAILIQPELQDQRMDGFGGLGGYEAAKDIYALPKPERDRVLDQLFGPDGARINILRSEIPWTGVRLPFTHRLYLQGFVYYFGDDDNEAAQYFLMRESQKRNEMLFNSCLWTPPLQWKDTASATTGRLQAGRFEDFADYLYGYLLFYKRLRNQDVHVLSIENQFDPRISSRSCHWSPQELTSFVKVLAKRLRGQGLGTKVMIPEVNWEKSEEFLKTAFDDPEAREAIAYIGVHSSEEVDAAKARVVEISKAHNAKLWQTEFTAPRSAEMSEIDDALFVARRMLRDLSGGACQAWLYGPLFSTAGGEGLLAARGSSILPTKRYWCFCQFSRYVPRDSVQISLQGSRDLAVAFRNPQYNGITVVLLNSSAEPFSEKIQLRGWVMERAAAYRTTQREDCSQIPLSPESGSERLLTLEPRSITTLVAQIRRIPASR